jgi:drug/metabolite transporter (DMT)-like permease
MTRRGWALFLAMCLIWGLPYLFIRIAVESVSPAALVFARTGIAAMILLPIALARGLVRPVLARWRPLLLFAVVEIMVPWVLLGHAETEITSSLAGLLVAAVPLFGALAFLLTPDAEKFSKRQVGGLVLGFVGVAGLVGLDVGHLSVLPILEMLGVAVCYAAGPLILSRWLSDISGLGVMACALTVTAVAFAPIGVLQRPGAMPAEAALSIVVLAVVCTALAFLLFVRLIAEAGPTRATVITYVNPAVAMLLGVLLLDERVTTGMVVGFPLILVGSVIAAGGAKARATSRSRRPDRPAGLSSAG